MLWFVRYWLKAEIGWRNRRRESSESSLRLQIYLLTEELAVEWRGLSARHVGSSPHKADNPWCPRNKTIARLLRRHLDSLQEPESKQVSIPIDAGIEQRKENTPLDHRTVPSSFR